MFIRRRVEAMKVRRVEGSRFRGRGISQGDKRLHMDRSYLKQTISFFQNKGMKKKDIFLKV